MTCMNSVTHEESDLPETDNGVLSLSDNWKIMVFHKLISLCLVSILL